MKPSFKLQQVLFKKCSSTPLSRYQSCCELRNAYSIITEEHHTDRINDYINGELSVIEILVDYAETITNLKDEAASEVSRTEEDAYSRGYDSGHSAGSSKKGWY